MAIIAGGRVIEGVVGPYVSEGVPGAGTDNIQNLVFSGSSLGGTFKLAFGGQHTGAINWSATNATLVGSIDAALEGLSTVGSSGCTTGSTTLTSGIGTVTVTFTGTLGKMPQPAIVANYASLTGTAAALTVSEATAGVFPAGIRPLTGALCVDTTNKFVYINTGTSLAPTWTKVGAQS
jgi:hypothetical protein